MPMFVGDVRRASFGPTSSSWKLSGGSQPSEAVTNVSKYLHVLRAALESTRGHVRSAAVHAGPTGRLNQ